MTFKAGWILYACRPPETGEVVMRANKLQGFAGRGQRAIRIILSGRTPWRRPRTTRPAITDKKKCFVILPYRTKADAARRDEVEFDRGYREISSLPLRASRKGLGLSRSSAR